MSKVLNIGYVKRDGKLHYIKKEDRAAFEKHVEDLREGQKVFAVFDLNADSGRLAQISKLKTCTRELARETGVTFESAQDEVKKRGGLPLDKTKGKYKSFADCSKEELSDCIQAVIEIGNFVGINFY